MKYSSLPAGQRARALRSYLRFPSVQCRDVASQAEANRDAEASSAYLGYLRDCNIDVFPTGALQDTRFFAIYRCNDLLVLLGPGHLNVK